MNNRLITAIVALPVLILSIILPYLIPAAPWTVWPFCVIAALALGAGMFEFYSLTKKLELKADAAIAYLGAAALFSTGTGLTMAADDSGAHPPRKSLMRARVKESRGRTARAARKLRW